MLCTNCSSNLHGKPKIRVEGQTYCFRCAKREVSARAHTREQSADNQYSNEKAVHSREKAAFEQRHVEWWNRRRAYVGTGIWESILTIIASVMAYYLADATAKGFGIVGVLVALLGWGFLWNARDSRRDAEFRTRDPEPQFLKAEPTRAPVLTVHHTPHDADGTHFLSRNYREEILRRDSFTCQVCGKKRQRRTLEVHHIIPRSKGGDDDPTNLIALCKYCHDREDWYEHVRMFPTTIRKKTKPLYRRHWRRSQ